MAFTQDYLKICYHYRGIYHSKRRIAGDWYGNLTTGELRAYDGKSADTFTGPDWFYIPDLDDLFEFLNNQIKAIEGADRPAKSIELKYQSDKGWVVVIELQNGLIHHSVNGDSPHTVLLNAIHALSVFIDRKEEKREHDKAEFMKKDYAEQLQREYTPRDELSTKPTGCRARPIGKKKRPQRNWPKKRPDVWTTLKTLWDKLAQR